MNILKTALRMVNNVVAAQVYKSQCADNKAFREDSAEAALIGTFTVMGDSWAVRLYDPLRQKLAEEGMGDWFDFHFHGYNGATVSEWASGFHNNWLATVQEIIVNDRGQPVVYISLGGDDIIFGYRWLKDQQFFDFVERDMHKIITELIRVRPDVHIIFGGYDFLNGGLSFITQMLAYWIFGECSAELVNRAMLGIGDIQHRMAAKYRQVKAAKLWGTLQGAQDMPNIERWSPSRYFYPFNGLHYKREGYKLFVDALYQWLMEEDILLAALQPAPADDTAVNLSLPLTLEREIFYERHLYQGQQQKILA